MVEGAGRGTLDLITVVGDNATIETAKGGFVGPVSLVQVGDTVYVFDVALKLRTQKPPPFTAYAVKLTP
jgi:hypothetical protein